MDIYKENKDIQELDEKSKEIIKQLEIIEKSLWLRNPEKRIAKKLRAFYFKIQNVDRNNEFEWEKLSIQYEDLLKQFNKQLDKWIITISSFYQTMSIITSELSKVKTIDWRLLNNIEIDWDIVDIWVALYDGLHNAIKITYEELRDFIKLIVEPDKFDEIWANIWNTLIKIMKDPYKFIQTLAEWTKEELWDLLRDIEVIENNSTKIGYIIILTGLITQVWVSKFLEQVWPWKFLAIMWIADKWGLNKLWKKEWGKPMKDNKTDDTQKEKVDIVDKKWEYMLDDNVNPIDASNKIWEYAEYLDVDYLVWDPERIEAIMEIIKSMWDYVVNNWEIIHWIDKIELNNFKSNFRQLRKKVNKAIDNPKTEKKLKVWFIILRKNKLDQAYYVLNPK